MLSEQARQTITSALAQCRNAGERRGEVKRLAACFGVSASTVYRAAPTGRSRARASNAEYVEWTRTAVAVAERAPDGPVALDLALAACIESDLLPAEAAQMPIGTAYRLRRQLGLDDRQGRLARITAEYPMQAIQFDGSSSKYISVVDGPDCDGDWLLRLYRRPISARGYKNKPLGPDRERLVAYGVTDICTGLRWSEYRIARGENALDAIDALVSMLSADPQSPRELCGVPDDLWLDLGPVTKSPITLDLLERLGINLVTGEPYRKTRMAVVERAWRTLWARFERSLFLLPTPELRLSELRERLTQYLVAENTRRPARVRVGEREVSRSDAWQMLVRQRARQEHPLREMPANALETLVQEDRRWVDATGRMRYRSEQWDVPDLHDTYVQVIASLDADHVIATCLRSGQRVTCRPLTAAAYGHPPRRAQTPLQRALAQPPAFTGADVFGGDRAPNANVTRLPAPVREAAPLADPLAPARCYPSLEAALLAFAQSCPVALLPHQHAQVIDIITAADLRVEAVAELARDILSSTPIASAETL